MAAARARSTPDHVALNAVMGDPGVRAAFADLVAARRLFTAAELPADWRLLLPAPTHPTAGLLDWLPDAYDDLREALAPRIRRLVPGWRQATTAQVAALVEATEAMLRHAALWHRVRHAQYVNKILTHYRHPFLARRSSSVLQLGDLRGQPLRVVLEAFAEDLYWVGTRMHRELLAPGCAVQVQPSRQHEVPIARYAQARERMLAAMRGPTTDPLDDLMTPGCRALFTFQLVTLEAFGEIMRRATAAPNEPVTVTEDGEVRGAYNPEELQALVWRLEGNAHALTFPIDALEAEVDAFIAAAAARHATETRLNPVIPPALLAMDPGPERRFADVALQDPVTGQPMHTLVTAPRPEGMLHSYEAADGSPAQPPIRFITHLDDATP